MEVVIKNIKRVIILSSIIIISFLLYNNKDEPQFTENKKQVFRPKTIPKTVKEEKALELIEATVIVDKEESTPEPIDESEQSEYIFSLKNFLEDYEQHVLARLQSHTCFTAICEENKFFLINHCQTILANLDIPPNYKLKNQIQHDFYTSVAHDCNSKMSQVLLIDNEAILKTNNIETIIYHLEKQDRYDEYFIKKLNELNFDYVAHKFNSGTASGEELWKIFRIANDPRTESKEAVTINKASPSNCQTYELFWNNKVVNTREFCD